MIKTSNEDSTTVVNMGAAMWAAWPHRPHYLHLAPPFTLPLAVGGYDVAMIPTSMSYAL